MTSGSSEVNLPDLQAAVQRTLRAIPPDEFEAALMSLPVRWMKCVSAEGHYFEGKHLSVQPENFGIEIVFGEENSSSESEEELDQDEQDSDSQ